VSYVDTGLNIVHVDDVAAGHLMAFDRGRVGERLLAVRPRWGSGTACFCGFMDQASGCSPGAAPRNRSHPVS